jgi:hypothetical protein
MKTSRSQLLLKISTYFLMVGMVLAVWIGYQAWHGKKINWTAWWVSAASIGLYPLCLEHRVKSLAKILGNEEEALESMRTLGELPESDDQF